MLTHLQPFLMVNMSTGDLTYKTLGQRGENEAYIM